MDLPTAIRNLITGSTAAPASSVTELVQEIAGAFGTRRPAGIPERTWRRARHQAGWTPAPPTLARLRAAQRRLWVLPARYRQLVSPGTGSVAIDADITVSNDSRRRTILVSGWPNPPDMAAVVTAYLRDDLPGAAWHFETGMGRNVDGPLYVGEVYGLEAFDTRAAALHWLREER